MTVEPQIFYPVNQKPQAKWLRRSTDDRAVAGHGPVCSQRMHWWSWARRWYDPGQWRRHQGLRTCLWSWDFKTIFFSPDRGAVKLDPSAGRLAGRSVKAAGTGGNSLGPHTTGRHQFFDIPALAFRTFGVRIIGRQHKLFKTVAAGLTLIFVNRHNRILQKQNFSYNRLYSSNVKQCKNRNPIVII